MTYLNLNEGNNLPAEIVCEMIETLRYLAKEHARGFQIDATNMVHVTKVLAWVDVALNAKFEPIVFERAAE
jgi:hypothetical protein